VTGTADGLDIRSLALRSMFAARQHVPVLVTENEWEAIRKRVGDAVWMVRTPVGDVRLFGQPIRVDSNGAVVQVAAAAMAEAVEAVPARALATLVWLGRMPPWRRWLALGWLTIREGNQSAANAVCRLMDRLTDHIRDIGR
jgi:hypothetical protein